MWPVPKVGARGLLRNPATSPVHTSLLLPPFCFFRLSDRVAVVLYVCRPVVLSVLTGTKSREMREITIYILSLFTSLMLGTLSCSLGVQCKCLRWWFLERKVGPPFLAVVRSARLHFDGTIPVSCHSVVHHLSCSGSGNSPFFMSGPLDLTGTFSTRHSTNIDQAEEGDAVTLER